MKQRHPNLDGIDLTDALTIDGDLRIGTTPFGHVKPDITPKQWRTFGLTGYDPDNHPTDPADALAEIGLWNTITQWSRERTIHAAYHAVARCGWTIGDVAELVGCSDGTVTAMVRDLSEQDHRTPVPPIPGWLRDLLRGHIRE